MVELERQEEIKLFYKLEVEYVRTASCRRDNTER